jgi:hypothetical protein
MSGSVRKRLGKLGKFNERKMRSEPSDCLITPCSNRINTWRTCYNVINRISYNKAANSSGHRHGNP